MKLNTTQVNELISLLQKLSFVSNDYRNSSYNLSEQELVILDKYVDDVRKCDGTDFQKAILSEALDDDRAKALTYKELVKFIKSGNFVPLTKVELAQIEYAKQQDYDQWTQFEELGFYGDLIKAQVIEALKFRKTARELASDLGHITKNYGYDWLTISTLIMDGIFGYGETLMPKVDVAPKKYEPKNPKLKGVDIGKLIKIKKG